MSTKHFKAIAAMAENRVIGCGNRIPWHLPEDFRWFKKMTIGQTIVMGRRTFESIGRALPDRKTIVVSRHPFEHPGVTAISDWKELDPGSMTGEVYICGGAQIYEQTLMVCSDLYLTHVKRVVEGDTFFPAFESAFEPVHEIVDNSDFRIVHYRNRAFGQVAAGSRGRMH